MGDFKGLIGRLDYLERLGVGALWLQPFYPSPLRDDGYDIADYDDIHPSYGTLSDFRRFLREAHNRGLKVITELVLNHTSDQHPWFQRARRAKPGSVHRDFYVWSDTPDKYRQARIIFKDFENSNWAWDPVANAYYWHRFYSHQPDLNFANPAVRRAMLKVVDHWLGMGVDGLRLDAVPYLFERQGTNCENLPETHAFLKELRAHVDAAFPDRMLLAEANQWPEDAVAYFGQGDECNMAFHFPIMPRIFMSLWAEDRHPIIDILEQTPAIPENSQWALFLRNHDELTLEMVSDEERDSMYRAYARDAKARINLGIRRRLAPLMQNNRRKMELINILLLSFPGTPILYYGDELGMGDNYHLGDRNGVRTPMQWSPDRNAGFSRANPQSLFLPVIIDSEYHYEVVNVETLERNQSSFLWWMRRLLAAYKAESALGRGSLEFVRGENTKVLALLRADGDNRLLAVINLSRHAQVAELDLAALAGCVPVDVFGRTRFPAIGREPYVLTMGPYDYFWFRLETEADPQAAHEAAWPLVLTGRAAREACALESLFSSGSEGSSPYWADLLPRLTGERTSEFCLTDELVLQNTTRAVSLVLAESLQQQGGSTAHFQVLSRIKGSLDEVSDVNRDTVLVRLDCPGGGERLINGLLDQRSLAILARFMASGRRRKSAAGVFFNETHMQKGERAAMECLTNGRVLTRTSQSMTVSLDNTVFLKIFLRPEEGVNPDLELPRLLNHREFPGVPRVLASLHYRRPHAQPMTLAVASTYVTGAVGGEAFVLEALDRFFGEVLAAGAPSGSDAGAGSGGGAGEAVIAEYVLELFRRLGQRAADLHLALATSSDPAFMPEPVTKLYLRSIYQGMRNHAHRAELAVEAARRADPYLGPLPKRALLERFSALLSLTPGGSRIRIHGDLTLENVLVAGKELALTDFDGDVRLPLGERRIKRSPLRDVASLLLSAAVAVQRGFARRVAMVPGDAQLLSDAMARWRQAACQQCLAGYLETVDGAGFLPGDDASRRVLFDVFVLEQGLRAILRALDGGRDEVAVLLAAMDSLRGIMS